MHAPDPVIDSEITIMELALAYAKIAEKYCRKNGKPISEWENAKRILRELNSVYGSTLAIDFGPLRFQAFRDRFIRIQRLTTEKNYSEINIVLAIKFAKQYG